MASKHVSSKSLGYLISRYCIICVHLCLSVTNSVFLEPPRQLRLSRGQNPRRVFRLRAGLIYALSAANRAGPMVPRLLSMAPGPRPDAPPGN